MNKEIWEEYPEIWNSKSAFMGWIRGGIRRSLWNKHPVKLLFMKTFRFKILNPNPKGKLPTVWGAKCSLTGEILPLNMMEVDHKVGGHSLKEIEDVNNFINGIVNVRLSDLQFVSKVAHRIKSYAERNGMSFDDALIEKKAIETIKSEKDFDFFAKRNIQVPSNKKERRAGIVKILKIESELHNDKK